MHAIEPPYLRIVARIRAGIAAGELRPGDRVPSTRELMRSYGVAMATATKALTALRREGLVEPRPGVGTVVARRPRARPAAAPGGPAPLDRIVAAAIRMADADGLAALSMRRLAAALGLPTMTLYRHVTNKEELLLLMTDAAFGEAPLPHRDGDGPAGGDWRARLETTARLQWGVYRRHPWAAEVMSFTRPPLAANAMAHTEWCLTALEAAGMPLPRAMHAAMMLANHVRGCAVNLEWEANAEQDTGLDNVQWFTEQEARFARITSSGRFPAVMRLAALGPDAVDYELDTLFEFGLARLLDGLAALLRVGA
ncbi:TetR/AcrR family transcriptional regulator C-terminal domain-containing protein [Dactylosporangium sp. NPDC048998]|uniref:TetR/AcrR family transcriptional regulator C-terminal domain-containing protein n=1 Tax=Dactylosporangium sp. NPDC048998 TaxID=3363976 RepID=UPI003723FCC9